MVSASRRDESVIVSVKVALVKVGAVKVRSATVSPVRGELVVAGVLSGNRNFEGRINPVVKANYLASPIHVVAFALTGTVDFNPDKDELGKDQKGKAVHLK